GALLELVPDPQTDRFRLSAEFLVDVSTGNDSAAGVYFAHTHTTLGPDQSLDMAVLLRFADDARSDQPRFREGDPVNLMRTTFLRNDEEQTKPVESSLAKYLVREAKRPGVRPWRKIVLEVVPGEMRAWWREPDQSLTPLHPNPAREDVLRNVVSRS